MSMRTFALSLTILNLATLPSPIAAQSCGCEVSDRKEQSFNQLLFLSAAERTEAEALHLPFGVPQSVSANERLLHQEDYVINYDDDLRMPTWVAYRLAESDLRTNRERTQCFRRDPRITDNNAVAFCDDYQEPVFDRGHMVPNADMVRSESAMINTYMFTNMAPQHDRFNQVIWARLERYTRDWARLKGSVHVITGAVFDRDGDGARDLDTAAERMQSTNGSTRVAVPTHFYKIILHERESGFIENMTFLLPHEDVSRSGAAADPFLIANLTTIDAIEDLVGVDFLADLDPGPENAIEANLETSMWPRPSN